MKVAERQKARSLRQKGRSINEIVEELSLSKASVSFWVRDIVLTEEQKEKLSQNGRSVESIEKRRINRLVNEKKKRQVVIDKAKEDFNNISLHELKIIGSMLYLGEGGKTKRLVRFANSDPLVIKMMMKFFREVCKVSEEKFRGHIHTFAHANVVEIEKHWSVITGIPQKAFYKTYIKPSAASMQKRNSLPFGTFDIYVCDTKLFLTIMGWIEKISELLLDEKVNYNHKF